MSLSNNFPTISPSLLLDFANTKRLDPRVTFTRSTTAVYYDGVTTALAEQNLLLQSQALATSPWAGQTGGFAPVVTNNAGTAPDGTNTATSIVFSWQYQNQRQSVVATPGITYTFSFWARVITGNTSLSFFHENSATGIFTNVSITTSWARYSVTVLGPSSSGSINFGIQDRNASGFGEIYIWGAQLEQRSSVTAYTPTTTASITNYIPQLLTAAANVPRFDCNPTTGESLGLLIEEQRTNLLLYSSDFDNNTWVKVNTSINANTVIAPDGTLSGDKLVITSTVAQHVLYQNVTTVTSQAYAQTFYIKKAEWSQRIRFSTVSGNVVLSLATTQPTFVSGDSTPTITDVGNGWYKVTIVAVEDSGGSVQVGRIVFQDNSGGENFAGDNFSGIYIWGAQFEAATFPTSYIPTAASTVTRNADAASMTGTAFSSWFNQNEGTFISTADTVRTSGYGGIISAGSGAPNRIDLGLIGPSGYQSILVNSVDVASYNDFNAINVNKYASNAAATSAIAYALNNSNAAVNGVAGTTDTVCTVPPVTELRIGYDFSTRLLNGHIRKIAYYPVRLSNTNLQALTL